MSQKPIIAVDFDDVISDYASYVVRFARREYDKNFTQDDLLENWSEMFDISQEEWLQWYDKFVIEEKFYENPSIISGAEVTLKKLHSQFNLVVLTSRPMFMRDASLKWLDNNLSGVFQEVIFANIYDSAWDSGGSDLHAQSRRNKAEMCQSIGAEYLIDDQPKHVNAAANCGVKALLFGDYAWNRDADIVDGVTRVADWGGVADYFGV